MVTSNINLSNTDGPWQKMVLKYTRPDLRKSLWQICNSFIPYVILWFLMYQSMHYSYWFTLLLAVVASGFLIRMFIIFHDCGHGSFFKSKKANDIVGMFMGILACTPYYKWHGQHHIHHANTGNLDKRGVGDVWTMTVDEFLKAPKGKQIVYRVFRNPFVMFTVGPLFMMFVQNRFTTKSMSVKEKQNVYLTNVLVLIMAVSLSLMMGIKAYLLIQLPVLFISHSMGLWLFYIQHQFEDATWERNDNWDYATAAIKGSSFLKLPAVLQWFTGNIGFHHVHHLSSRIPNYNLPKCHYENDLFKEVKPILLKSTFKALWLNLWDEESLKLISFKGLASKKLQISAAS